MSETTHYYLVAPLTFTGTSGGHFTYQYNQSLAAGQIVKIPLGPRQSLGVVAASTQKPGFATKPIAQILDLSPLPSHIIGLAAWMSAYYFSSSSSVWQTILPTGITKKRRAAKPLPKAFTLPAQEHSLTADQTAALTAIRKGKNTAYLLQGVTGSGKTRVYLELAQEALTAGKSVIVLIPEIALTPQLIALFEASFPDRVVPFHSALTESAKHRAWQNTLESTAPLIVVGPRSALFLPLKNIGLIVVDECQETSYKQEQNPRYHAIAVAGKLAALTNARLILGSATPGLWEVYLATAGKIGLVKLPRQANNLSPTAATIIDLRNKNQLKRSRFLSTQLLAAIEETLAQGRQSLLFLNRRGSASSQICGDCGYVAACPHCHLPFTFHADHLKLVCHLCNFHEMPAAVCPICSSANLRFLGSGTKRIETEIARLFPAATLARLDKDSADPKSLLETYRDLHDGTTNILIGTQMIAKGLDLPMVDTVGIVNADTLLHMPDYTSAERTFQLLAQVSGRTGRGDRLGQVFIQTYTPDHPAIVAASQTDFWAFAKTELQQRQLLGYPPYRYLLKLTFSHPSEAKTKAETQRMHTHLRSTFNIQRVTVLGPAPAFHERAGGRYNWQLVIKSASRTMLVDIARSLPATWKTDLDPVNLL